MSPLPFRFRPNRSACWCARGPATLVVSSPGKISVATFPHLHLVTTLDVGKSARDLAFSLTDATLTSSTRRIRKWFSWIATAPTGIPPKSNSQGHGSAPYDGTLAELALSPDGKTLVVSAQHPDLLTFISTETRQTLGTVEVGQSPGPLAILPDSSKVFVADTGEEKISAADVASRKLLSHIEIGARPTGLLVKPDGGELFVFAAPSSKIIIADAFHDNVEQTFSFGRDPAAGVFRQDMSVLYIANAGDGSVIALDAANPRGAGLSKWEWSRAPWP